MEKTMNKQIKILLVEDNLINIKVFTTILADYGYTNITVAKTGEDALALALLAPFDIIFLDIGLPGISGLEVCKQLRQQFPDQKLPIVVLTACGVDVEEESIRAGCSEFFAKPVNAEQLISTIERWSPLSSEPHQDYFY